MSFSLPDITTFVKGAAEPKFDGWNVLGGLTGLGSSIYNMWANKRDFDYQKALQKQIFEREDTAVQRRMEDLKAAGLNPNLAAGSSAGAGAVVGRSTTNDVNMGAALDTMAAVSQIKAQNIQNQILNQEYQIARYKKEQERVNTQLGYFSADYDYLWYEFLNAKDTDLYRDEYGNTPMDYFKEKYPTYYQLFNNIIQDQKNSSEILSKQNKWFNANQWINAGASVLGAASGAVTAGSNAYKAANTIKRYR